MPRASALVARFLLVAKAQGVIDADFFASLGSLEGVDIPMLGSAAAFSQKLFEVSRPGPAIGVAVCMGTRQRPAVGGLGGL